MLTTFTLRVCNVLIDNIFHHIYVPLSLGLIALVDLWFSQIWLKMHTVLCLTGASILERARGNNEETSLFSDSAPEAIWCLRILDG